MHAKISIQMSSEQKICWMKFTSSAAIAREAREQAQLSQERAGKLERELNQRLEQLEDERLKMVKSTRHEMEVELITLHHEMDEVRRALNRAKQPLDVIHTAEAEARKSRRQGGSAGCQATDPVWGRGSQPENRNESACRFDRDGRGCYQSPESDAEVQIGRLRLRARFSDLSQSWYGYPEPVNIPLQNEANRSCVSTQRPLK